MNITIVLELFQHVLDNSDDWYDETIVISQGSNQNNLIRVLLILKTANRILHQLAGLQLLGGYDIFFDFF
jgi:hypothetical protein